MRLWLGLSLILVLGAGFAVGVVVRGVWERDRSGGRRDSAAEAFDDLYADGPFYLVTSETVYEELALSGEQREDVDQLLANYYRDVRQARDAIRGIAGALEDGMQNLLTDGQNVKLAAIQERYAERELHLNAAGHVVRLRQVARLEPQEEARVYQLFIEAARQRRDLWCRKPRPKRDVLRGKMKAIAEQRDQGLKELLSAPQYEAYEEMKRKEWPEHRRHKRKGHRKAEKVDEAEKADEQPQTGLPAVAPPEASPAPGGAARSVEEPPAA